MEEIRLKGEFLRIKDKDNYYYGGAQEWAPKKYVRDYGCGVVSSANVIKTLECKGKDNIYGKEDFTKFCEDLRKKYLPVIPKFGMNGLFMALGMNAYFLFKSLPYRAFWGVKINKLYREMERMLREGIPVVLAIGPNFPNLFGKHKLSLYDKRNGKYAPTLETKAHYVTVTGFDDKWIRISSWGKQYFINREEYALYIKKYSLPLFSNILLIKRKKQDYF